MLIQSHINMGFSNTCTHAHAKLLLFPEEITLAGVGPCGPQHCCCIPPLDGDGDEDSGHLFSFPTASYCSDVSLVLGL